MPFAPILRGFVADHPQVKGVIFCDEEGERVEAATRDETVDLFDIEVTGASLATVLRQLERYGAGSSLRTRHDDRTIWTQLIEDGYYVTALCDRGPADAKVGADLVAVAEALRSHM